MSDTNETITNIIKNLRAEADYIEESARGSLKAGETLAGTPFTEADLESALYLAEMKRKEADRLEAALKRDTLQLRREIEHLKDERNKAPVRERERLRKNGFVIVPQERLLTKPAENVNSGAASDSRDNSGNAAKLREALEALNCINTGGLKRLLAELVELDIFDGGLINKTIAAVEKASAPSPERRETDNDRVTSEEKPMSLYNLINGFSPACLLIMPMLGRKQDEWPRFRDCHIDKNGDTREIHIFTRVGSANQGYGCGEEELYKEPNFLRFVDCVEDTTYGTYVFKCPKEWEVDFDRINDGNLSELSPEYYEMQSKFWEKGEDMVAKIKELVSRIENRQKEIKERGEK